MNDYFLSAYKQTINDSLANHYSDNWDVRRFGPEKMLSVKNGIKHRLKVLLGNLGFYDTIANAVLCLGENVENFEWLWQQLTDEESRQVMVQVMAFRVLGHRRVKLPLNNPDYWAVIEKAEKLAVDAESIDLGFMGWQACKMNLASIGYPINLFLLPAGLAALLCCSNIAA